MFLLTPSRALERRVVSPPISMVIPFILFAVVDHLFSKTERKLLTKSFDCGIIVLEMKGGMDMSITATEFKMNLGKYLLLSQTEDIYITKNGKVVAKLTNPNQDRVDIAKSLFGVIPADVTVEEAREERLSEI